MSKETTHSDYNNLKKNAENTKDSAKDLVKDAANALSSDNVKEIASKIVNDISDFLENKKDELGNVKNKYKEQIKDSPFLVVIGALVAGAILSLLFRK